MLRNLWIAIGTTLLTGSMVLAQPPGYNPYANPGGVGYPGYGPPMMPPNGYPPMMPPNGYAPMGPGGIMPYGPPMNPYAPTYGNPLPTPIPPDPRRPVPVHDEAGPKAGATEPYMVLPERSGPAKTLPPAKDVPPSAPAAPAPAANGPLVELAEFGPPGPPAEPYTLYEGRRYLAEVKQDNVCVWGDISFIHWWTRHDNTTPLLTTGPAVPSGGTLGSPDTRLLVGGPIAPHEFSGVRTNLGLWLDPERLCSLEFSGFYLGKNSRQYDFASDANGNNVIARPAVTVFPPSTTMGEGSFFVAFPGAASGAASISSVMSLYGAEINFGRNLIRLNGWTVDWLLGFRYLYLNDTLTSTQRSTVLAGGAATFMGVPQAPGANFVLNDSFNLTNRFYGGQLGVRADWVCCRGVDLGAAFKIAFGNTAHTAIIDGTTTLNANGMSSTTSGGAYAMPSNIGQHGSNDFSVVPELTLTASYQVHPNVRFILGYNLIYWTRVERAGEQIERTIDPGQSPTSPTFVPGTIGTFPRFPNVHSDFWAQGINLGVEVKY